MNDFKCRLADFAEDETHTVKGYSPQHAAAVYAEWSDRQAGEGYSPEQTVCVWVDGQWQEHVVKASSVNQYAVDGSRPAVASDGGSAFAAVRSQRDALLAAVRYAGASLSQSATYDVPPIVVRDVAERLNRVNQELNLP